MTDGAARLIEQTGDPHLRGACDHQEQRQRCDHAPEPWDGGACTTDEAYGRLVSRDPQRFWTSGQWMTERPGGSDVGRTESLAMRQRTCQQASTHTRSHP
jgi:hypothetical protein